MDATKTDLVLFDGECAMCNRFVQWVLRVDTKQRFRFAPLNGKTSQTILNKTVDPTSIIIINDLGHSLTESDAILYLIQKLPLPWSLGRVGYVMPKKIRNAIYRWVAKRRHRLLPGTTACAIASVEERARFLN